LDYSSDTSTTVYSFSNGDPSSVYSTHAYAEDHAPLIYNIPVSPTETYNATLRFAENWSGAWQQGARILDVYINGVLIEENLDVWSEGGNFGPYNIEHSDVSSPDGSLTIRIVPKILNAYISGIDVVSTTESNTDVASSNPDAAVNASQDSTPTVVSIDFNRIFDNYPFNAFESFGTAMSSGGIDYLVVLGGFRNFPGVTNEAYRRPFGQAQASWERIRDVPGTEVTHAAQAVDEDILCAVGGFEGRHPGRSGHTAYCYNLTTDSYRMLPDFPADRAGGGLTILKNSGRRTLIYAGGVDRPQNSLASHTDYGTTWTMDIDTENPEWTLIPAAMPDPRTIWLL